MNAALGTSRGLAGLRRGNRRRRDRRALALAQGPGPGRPTPGSTAGSSPPSSSSGWWSRWWRWSTRSSPTTSSIAFVADNNSRATPLHLLDHRPVVGALPARFSLWGFLLSVFVCAVVWRFRADADDRVVAWATLVMFLVAAFFIGLMVGPANPFPHVHRRPHGPGGRPELAPAGQPPRRHPPAPPLPRLRRLHGARSPSPSGCSRPDGWATDGRSRPGAGPSSRGPSCRSASCSGPGGRTRCSAGAASGPGTRSRTRRSCPGCAAPPTCTRCSSRSGAGCCGSGTSRCRWPRSRSPSSGPSSPAPGSSSRCTPSATRRSGPVLIGFFLLVVVVGFGLIAWRGDRIRSPGGIDAPLGREGAFLLNNLLFVGFAFVVLLGTVFPLLYEAIKNQQVTVGAPYFNTVAVPIGLALLFLMALAPALSWRTVERRCPVAPDRPGGVGRGAHGRRLRGRRGPGARPPARLRSGGVRRGLGRPLDRAGRRRERAPRTRGACGGSPGGPMVGWSSTSAWS